MQVLGKSNVIKSIEKNFFRLNALELFTRESECSFRKIEEDKIGLKEFVLFKRVRIVHA